jgi:quinol monooxygenase YgiN
VSELQGIARFTFHEGKLEEFKRLSARCMEIVRTKDTGTLQYDIYFNDDQSECIVLERGSATPRRSSSTRRTLAT